MIGKCILTYLHVKREGNQGQANQFPRAASTCTGRAPAERCAKPSLTSFWLSYSCKGASHYGLTKDRKRRSQDGCPDGSTSLTATSLSPEISTVPTVSLMTDEPGLDNPAYVSTAEDGQPNSPLDSGRSNRTRGESNRWLSGNGLLCLGTALCETVTVESPRNVLFKRKLFW